MDNAGINKLYGKNIRLRVCGLYIENNTLLMVKHKGLGKKRELWIPPGGGVEYGSTIEKNLKREFLEETGLIVKVDDFLFVYEYRNILLHSIELFFKVTKISGEIKKGFDPEYTLENQIIESVQMMPFSEIDMIDKSKLHGIFFQCKKASDVVNQRGFFIFED